MSSGGFTEASLLLMQQHYPEIYARMYDDKLEGKLTPERMKYYATLVKQAVSFGFFFFL